MLLKIRSQKQNVTVVRSRKVGPKYLALLLVSSLGLWLGYKQLQSYFVRPEGILVLGGHADRERFAAKLAAQHPNLPIWVSSGSPQRYVTQIFAKAGVKSDRLHLNYHAKDTVTNFTTLVDELKSQGINSVYLVTSDNHMARARIIGEIVFGTHGIILKPVSVPSHHSPESLKKLLRDTGRSLLWLGTGKTGETLLPP